MKQIFSIKDISTYRSELMGWAIVWIMMLHFTFTQIKPLGFISQFGFAGVEIFMLVSGLGLYFSLDRDDCIGRFYKRRLLRIFPTYYIIGIFASLFLFNDNILTYLFRYSTIGFWTRGTYWEWYVPSIVVLYLLAPFLKILIDKRLFIFIAIFSIIFLCISYVIVDKEVVETREPHFFLLYRIPTFILGMVCAYWMKRNVSPKYFYLILLIGIPCFALLFPHHHEIYNYKYFSIVFLLPTFILCFVTISKYVKVIQPLFSCIGKASLEVYLIQSIFFHAIITKMIVIPPIWHDTFTVSLMIVSSLLGIWVHWLIDKSGIQRLL